MASVIIPARGRSPPSDPTARSGDRSRPAPPRYPAFERHFLYEPQAEWEAKIEPDGMGASHRLAWARQTTTRSSTLFAACCACTARKAGSYGHFDGGDVIGS